jgi:hypothetical protein
MEMGRQILTDCLPVEIVTGNGHKAAERWQNIPVTCRTVAIVGSHPATRELAPYDDPSIEIWLFNEAAQKPEVYKRWDKLVQIHLPEVYSSLSNWVNQSHWDWLQQDHGDSKTIWMQDVDPRVPNSRRYPLEDILAMTPRHYLRSSPAMALALAIHEGYKKIMLFGSELTSNTEYTYQATNLAYWIGFADGRGTELDLRCWQSEFDQLIYGYEGELQLDRSHYLARFDLLKAAWSNYDKAMKRTQESLNTAMLDNDYAMVSNLILGLDDVAIKAGEAFGAMSEAGAYSQREDIISRQEFEKRAAKAQQEADKLRSDKDHEGGKVEYVYNVWLAHKNIQALQQLREFVKAKTQYALDMGIQAGIYHENMDYLSEYDRLLQAAGGVRALGNPEAYRGPGK